VRDDSRLTLAEAFGRLRSDYDLAKQSRFRRRRRGLPSLGSHADYHLRSDVEFLKMIEIARDFDRNDLVTGQGITRLINNFVLGGFRLDPMTGDKELDLLLWERWQEWATDPEQCDATGELDWASIEKLAPRHVFVDGDVFLLPLDSGRLQLIEAHRCRTPSNTKQNVVNGVLLDEQRRRIEYWFTQEDVSPLSAVSRVKDMRRIAARSENGERQVIHLYRPKRVSQTRGVSAFAAIGDAVGMHGDIQFAKLVQQQIVSCITFLRERPVDVGWGAAPQTGERTIETQSDGSKRVIEGISPGLEITGRPGEKITGFSPQVPNPEYRQHVMLVLELIAANLDLPIGVFLLDPTLANFSSQRGTIEQAKVAFREHGRWETTYLHRPVYRWKVRQWLSEDLALRTASQKLEGGPEAIYKHRWNPPEQPYLDPLKDAQADNERLQGNHISPRRLHAEYGRDWEEIVEETVADNAYAIREAKAVAAEINAESPDAPVNWRDLLNLQVSGTGAKSAGAIHEEEPRQGGEPKEPEDIPNAA